MFVSIPSILPEKEVGIARIEHFDVARSFWSDREGVRPGRYARLYVGAMLMMSDTDMEHRTNWEVARRAHGRVLIAGLGIGLILTAILDKPEVTSVTVVEKHADVIALVGPYYEHPKLTIVCGDIFDWKPVKGTQYDVIYFDIWPDLSTDILGEMATLHRRFARCLDRDNPNCWMDSWCKGELRAQRRRDRYKGW